MTLQNGGQISSSTYAAGDAGDVFVNASNSIKVSGMNSIFLIPTQITSSAINSSISGQKLLGLPPFSSGKSGNTTIDTSHLRIADGGLISGRNEGTGIAGKLTVNASSIFLDNKGSITASTASGEGGNVNLNAQNLQLRHNSLITAAAGGSGNGGNINIYTATLAGGASTD